jgi:hypothetical protein
MTEPTQPDRATSTPSPGPLRGRRRFLGAGATSTPALILLASQPALGATCFTPSRSLSANTSVSQQGKYGVCTGISPGNYKTQTSPTSPAYNWPSAPVPSTEFHALFSKGSGAGLFTVGLKKGGTRSLTLLEVLALPNVPKDVSGVPADPSKLAFHLIGAYLNIQNRFVPSVVLTSSQVLTIWGEYASKGYFEPTAGIKWYPADIVAYLKNGGIAP